MFGFRRKNKEVVGAATSSAVAVEGGWSDGPEEDTIDEELQDDFFEAVLKRAHSYAHVSQTPVGQLFESVIEDVPDDISNANQIVSGLIPRSQDYGLLLIAVSGEHAFFMRLK